ncbi:MAG: TetR/AcrR family transcriptional regulator [Desulfarculaceae bacterium]|nr:TetR/AcrR family transcriptional regulator [Desulfarculaceae bacterium]
MPPRKKAAPPAPEAGNKQEARSRRTTGRLLAEARRLFSAQGYAATSAEEIVAAAGVTRGALYHHYEGKKGLFRAVVEQVQGEVAQRVRRAVERAPLPLDKLIAGNSEFLTACLSPDVRRILLIDGPAVLGWEQWRAIDEANVLGHYQDFLRLLMDQGALRPQPVEALAHIISGAANEAALWAAQAENPEQALAQAQAAMGELIRSLGV